MSGASKKVVLINPPVHDLAAYDLWSKPFGLLVIAEHLKQSGVEVHLVDATDPFHTQLNGLAHPKRRNYGAGNYYSEEIPKPEAFKNLTRKFRRYGLPPDRLEIAMAEVGDVDAVLVGCSMTYWYPGAFEAIKLARKLWPQKPVILGGIYATLCPDHAIQNAGADFVLPGLWEESLDRFNEITGIAVKPAKGPLMEPALNLYSRLDYATLMLTRGCPFRCNYCASSSLFDGYITRAVDDVIPEISRWIHNGVQDFAFYDDALLWEPERIIVPLLEQVLENGWDVRFHAPNGLHLARIDLSLARLMHRAGFKTIRLGVESLSSKRLREWDNKANPDRIREVAATLLKAGYRPGEVGAYILTGVPGQTAKELENDIRALIDIGLRPYLAEYSPLPGTAMFDKAFEGSTYDLKNEPLTHNNTFMPCADPSLTFDELERLKKLTRPDQVIHQI